MVQLFSTISTQKVIIFFKHDDPKTIENAVISTEILKTDNDDINKNKRKREKNIYDDDKLPAKRHYFYDYLLK